VRFERTGRVDLEGAMADTVGSSHWVESLSVHIQSTSYIHRWAIGNKNVNEGLQKIKDFLSDAMRASKREYASSLSKYSRYNRRRAALG
jgi:hypothetical protein